MIGALASVRAQFGEIIEARSNASSDVAFGLGGYTDEGAANFGFRNLLPMSTDTEKVKEAIDSLRTSSDRNPDTEEAALVALSNVATLAEIGWRQGSRRVVVWIGDNPGHEPSCVGNRTVTRASVATEMESKGISVIAVGTRNGVDQLDASSTSFGCTGAQDAGEGQATFIANRTGGAVVNGNTDSIVDAIVTAVGGLQVNLSADTSSCSVNVDISFEPELPVSVSGGVEFAFEQVITPTSSACSNSPYSCTVLYIGSGAEIGKQNITVQCA